MWSLKNLFAKTGNTAPPAPATSALMNEQAIDRFADLLSTIPDPDTILQSLNFKRHDLRKLENDDEISGSLDTRREAVISTPWRLEPGEGKAVDFIWDQLDPFIETLQRGAWAAVPYGYSVTELVYERLSGGRIGIQSAVEKPMEWFAPQRGGGLKFFDKAAPITGIEVDTVYKFMLTVRHPTHRNPYGDALLSKLYWPWFFRHNGWNFWMQFLERHGSPILLGKGANPQKLADALAKVVQDAVIAVGRDDEVTTVSANGSGESFSRAEEALVRRIQKVVLGQTLTSGTDGGSGNRALGEVHNQVRMDKRNADIRLVSKTIQRVVNALTYLNFPNEQPPEFIIEDEQGLATDRAERDSKLYSLGVRFKPEYITRTYDLEDDEFELTSGQPPVGDGRPGDNQANGAEDGGEDDEGAAEQEAQQQAMRVPHHQFAASPRGSRAQQEIDSLASVAIRGAGSPFPVDVVRKAIQMSSNPDELVANLHVMLDGYNTVEFRDILERAMFAADVLGYVAAEHEAR